MKKFGVLFLLLAATVTLSSCGGGETANTGRPLQNPGDTPTEAYKRLFAAVKSRNTEAIKTEVSQKTQGLAESLAARQNKPIEAVYENGFTATTFAAALPEIRDERVKDRMGAVEVWNSKDSRWEDLPYIREESGWKLAVGDVFANTWSSPGVGRDQKEKLAANAASGNKGIPALNTNANANYNANGGSPAPKR